ncbi:hypothetical protein M0805_000139 [Coniferiporia weirii]|nr:hypothetical protein M0805_000139 [Coniferiporia weirii]
MPSTEFKRGVKRKREAAGKDNEEDISATLRAKLHHGAKEVKRASKKARTFETQKVVKKLKDARKANDDENAVISLEAQLECLKKHIDHEHIAVRALRSKINKDAVLSRNQSFQDVVASELKFPDGTNPAEVMPQRASVVNRLLSSKVLAQEISRLVQTLRTVLGEGAKDKGTQVISEDDIAEEVEEDPAKGMDAVASDDDSEPEEAEGNSNGSWGGFDDEDEDASEQEAVDDGWESGSVHSQDSDDVQSSSTSIEGSRPVSPVPQKALKKARPAPERKPEKAGESTFLPSLSVGFVAGGSDSEWSDAEADLADSPMKKNRRGQRARKAIWEKKYGKNANHLKKQVESGDDAVQRAYESRARGGAPGRGLPNSHGRGRGAPRQGVQHRPQVPQDQGYSSRPAPGFAKEDLASKPLHPSWEAKRRLKEKQSAAIVPAQGTRTKFV